MEKSRVLGRFTRNLPPGKLQWIGLRPARHTDMIAVDTVNAIVDRGLEGDRQMQNKPGSSRQVTLISREYIQQIAHFLQRDSVAPELLRRNLVVSGINLSAVRFQVLQIGEVLLEVRAWCHPCSRMEKNLGAGGFAAMIGHGGVCAKVVQGGKLAVGDSVVKIDNDE